MKALEVHVPCNMLMTSPAPAANANFGTAVMLTLRQDKSKPDFRKHGVVQSCLKSQLGKPFATYRTPVPRPTVLP